MFARLELSEYRLLPVAKRYRNVRVILIVDGEPLPIHWGLYERIAAMVLGLSREESAQALGLSPQQVQGVRSIGTQLDSRIRVLTETYGETIEMQRSQQICPQLLMLLLSYNYQP